MLLDGIELSAVDIVLVLLLVGEPRDNVGGSRRVVERLGVEGHVEVIPEALEELGAQTTEESGEVVRGEVARTRMKYKR